MWFWGFSMCNKSVISHNHALRVDCAKALKGCFTFVLSIFDIFKIGIGPSSSHTVGPMRIALRFLEEANDQNKLEKCARIQIDLHGSLALTGIGHGSDRAVILGLMGYDPATIDIAKASQEYDLLQQTKRLGLNIPARAVVHEVDFDSRRDLALRGDIIPDLHPNEMCLSLYDRSGDILFRQVYYSVGGGFIASEKQLTKKSDDDLIARSPIGPNSFASANELIALAQKSNISIAEVILQNEDARRPRDKTYKMLDDIWQVMSECIDRGLGSEGVLPGALGVKRRAPELIKKLRDTPLANDREQLFDWLNVYAMAVNEENAAGGKVVTAPTNGAAGIIPSVIRHYCCEDKPNEDHVRIFLATAAGVAMLYKQRASISGAEMGCQGEVGVACSMAAAGLAAVWGATLRQVETAAEIGMEHNLGLTCDPVGGLVQIPCIERNAIGAVKAVNAARLAIRASESQKVSLDQVIETMRQTGIDMSRKYKETSEGGLAVNVIEC